MDGRKLVVVLGGTVPASGGTERMSKAAEGGNFPPGFLAYPFPKRNRNRGLSCPRFADDRTQDR
jgi:hypothetical protein